MPSDSTPWKPQYIPVPVRDHRVAGELSRTICDPLASTWSGESTTAEVIQV